MRPEWVDRLIDACLGDAVGGLLALPLVLPPTVIGYYLLVMMGNQTTLGALYERLAGHTLAFSFAP